MGRKDCRMVTVYRYLYTLRLGTNRDAKSTSFTIVRLKVCASSFSLRRANTVGSNASELTEQNHVARRSDRIGIDTVLWRYLRTFGGKQRQPCRRKRKESTTVRRRHDRRRMEGWGKEGTTRDFRSVCSCFSPDESQSCRSLH